MQLLTWELLTDVILGRRKRHIKHLPRGTAAVGVKAHGSCTWLEYEVDKSDRRRHVQPYDSRGTLYQGISRKTLPHQDKRCRRKLPQPHTCFGRGQGSALPYHKPGPNCTNLAPSNRSNLAGASQSPLTTWRKSDGSAVRSAGFPVKPCSRCTACLQRKSFSIAYLAVFVSENLSILLPTTSSRQTSHLNSRTELAIELQLRLDRVCIQIQCLGRSISSWRGRNLQAHW